MLNKAKIAASKEKLGRAEEGKAVEKQKSQIDEPVYKTAKLLIEMNRQGHFKPATRSKEVPPHFDRC